MSSMQPPRPPEDGAAPAFAVLKFGGTSVASPERWDSIHDLVRQRQEAGLRVLVVVSAVAGVTNALQAIIDAAARGEKLHGLADELVRRHRALAQTLGIEGSPALDPWLNQLLALARDPRAQGTDYAWQAELLALGELLSSSMGVAYLQRRGLAVDWLDARDWLVAQALPHASAWSRWLNVNCASAENPVLQATLRQGAPVRVTQGFIARNPDGATAILGRGGSDTSAAYFGALLRAKRVEIWTDVAGMFTANPRQVPQARLLKRLDYEEAQEIATTGAKVLHPRCLNPVREAGVPLWVKDTHRPDLEGTQVVRQVAHTAPSVKALSARTGITLVAMETIGMWQEVGFLADVFAIFRKHGLSVDLIGSAETNVTVSLDPSENLLNSNVLEALCGDLRAVCRVKVITPCAAITLVGRGMRSLLHQLAPVWAEFGQRNVHLITQSANDLNLTFVVDEAIAAPLLPRLHQMLMRAQAMRVDDAEVFGASYEDLYPAGAAPVRQPPWWVGQRAALLRKMGDHASCYVYALDEVRRAARRLKEQLPAVDRWLYAMKANAHPGVLQTAVEEGFGVECVSLAELRHACGHLPALERERILFTPNFAPREEYAQALELGVRVTVDNLHPLLHWPELWHQREVLLRLDLGYGRGHHGKVVTGGLASKFGLTLADAERFRELARGLQLRVVGLHAHLGSGILEAAHFRETYAELASLAEQFPDCGDINIGGGLGVPARPEDVPLDLLEVGKGLAEVKALYPHHRLWMEPGRYLVADAGVLLTRVTQIKHKAHLTYVGVQTGMNSLLRPALYDAYHEIANLTRLDQRPDTLCQVVGPICESGDVLGINRRLPAPQEGDVLLVAQAGAYGAVLGSHYNMRAPAPEVVL